MSNKNLKFISENSSPIKVLEMHTLKKNLIISLYSIVAPLILIGIVILAIGDSALFILINWDLANPLLDFTCAYLLPALFLILYIATLLSLYRTKNHRVIAVGATSLLNGPLSYVVGSLIKRLIMRPRPLDTLSSVRIVGIWHTSSFSLPSTTTMLVFGLTLPIFFDDSRRGALLLALSYFIGLSVIYTGFHFPLDVAAGILLSLAITLFTVKMEGVLSRTFQKLGFQAEK